MDLHRIFENISSCSNDDIKETLSDQVVRIVSDFPESIITFTDQGRLPLHTYCLNQSFDEVVLENILLREYPGAQRVCDREGYIPFHMACQKGTLSYRILICHSHECYLLLLLTIR